MISIELAERLRDAEMERHLTYECLQKSYSPTNITLEWLLSEIEKRGYWWELIAHHEPDSSKINRYTCCVANGYESFAKDAETRDNAAARALLKIVGTV